MAAPDCCEALGLSRVIVAFFAPMITFITWLITYRLTKRSERRKEDVSKIEKLCEQIDSIHKLAYQYHSADAEDRSLATEIHVLIRIFVADLVRARLMSLEQTNLTAIGLRRAVTYENFETHDFKPRQRLDPLLKRIDKECEHAKALIEASRA